MNCFLAEIAVELYFLIVVLGIVALVLLGMVGKFISLWFQAFVSGTPIAFFNIIGMSLRKIPPRIIVSARINLFKAGLKDISVAELETHFLAGGNVPNVVNAMIAADKANIELDWRQATAIDLAGRDVKGAVQTSVYPKVIDCPQEGYNRGVAQDGIEVRARARVTVRTNIKQLVGGATEETIIARVGEGIVSAIGGCREYKDVLQAPDVISKEVLGKGLDSATAFQILSIDIIELLPGDNVGARLKADKAEADKRVAQAKAEERRAMAVAKTQEMKAELVQSQAEVPKAMAEAFRKGHLGIMDYQRIQNVQADTDMRKTLSEPESGKDKR